MSAWRDKAIYSTQEARDHWRRLRDLPIGDEPQPGAHSCELCLTFRLDSMDDPHVDCGKCPIRLMTGCHGCEGTPFADAEEAYFESWERRNCQAARADWVSKATAEIEFLDKVLDGIKTGEIRP